MLVSSRKAKLAFDATLNMLLGDMGPEAVVLDFDSERFGEGYGGTEFDPVNGIAVARVGDGGIRNRRMPMSTKRVANMLLGAAHELDHAGTMARLSGPGPHARDEAVMFVDWMSSLGNGDYYMGTYGENSMELHAVLNSVKAVRRCLHEIGGGMFGEDYDVDRDLLGVLNDPGSPESRCLEGMQFDDLEDAILELEHRFAKSLYERGYADYPRDSKSNDRMRKLLWNELPGFEIGWPLNVTWPRANQIERKKLMSALTLEMQPEFEAAGMSVIGEVDWTVLQCDAREAIGSCHGNGSRKQRGLGKGTGLSL